MGLSALQMFRNLGVQYKTAFVLMHMAHAYKNLGSVYDIRGDLEQAEAMYKKSLALFQEIGAAPQVKHIRESIRTRPVGRPVAPLGSLPAHGVRYRTDDSMMSE